MAARQYRSTVESKTLSAGINSSVTSITLNSVTTLPSSYPYTLVIDPDTATEEIVTVTASGGGNVLTVTRAQDGTSGQSHDAAAVVKHMITARDLQEAQDHIAASSAVHGLSGTVVGTSDTQSLTNKTVNLTSNTLTGTTAQFNSALSDGNFATQAGTETLTNKTLTSPKINEDVEVTATATELNTLDGITASTAELNIMDGVTATAAELNILDGATLSTAELNYVDGVTSAIQTQLDSKQPTITGGATTIDTENLTASRALVSDGSGKVAVSSVTSTELALLSGLTNTGWVSDAGSVGGSWNGSGYSVRAKRFLNIVTIHLYLIREGSRIANSDVDGNMTDTLVMTLDAAYQPTYSFTVNFDVAGKTGGSAFIDNDGTIYLRSMYDEDSDIEIGDSVRISATYLV